MLTYTTNGVNIISHSNTKPICKYIKNNVNYELEYFCIEEVARILCCSVDTVRRIPKQHLPFSKPGKRNRYRKQDIDAYMLLLQKSIQKIALNDNQSSSVINSIIDGVRGAKSSKGSHHV